MRPPKATKRRARSERDAARERAAAGCTTRGPCHPHPDVLAEGYVNALELLRVDVRHGESPCEVEELNAALRCQGWDVFASELVADAVRAKRVEPKHLLGILGAIVEQYIRDHGDDTERGRALVLLNAAYWSCTDRTDRCGAAYGELRTMLGNEWGTSSLVIMAIGVLDFADALPAPGDGYSVGELEHHTREVVRAVFDHAGLEAARRATARIQSRLAEPDSYTLAARELAERMVRWTRDQAMEW